MRNFTKYSIVAVLALSASVHASIEGINAAFAFINEHNSKRFDENLNSNTANTMNSNTMLSFLNNVIKSGSEGLEEGTIQPNKIPLNGWTIPVGIKQRVDSALGKGELGTFIYTKLTMGPKYIDLGGIGYKKLSIERDKNAPEENNYFAIYAGNNLVASFKANDV